MAFFGEKERTVGAVSHSVRFGVALPFCWLPKRAMFCAHPFIELLNEGV
jgi:hypothetical protein